MVWVRTSSGFLELKVLLADIVEDLEVSQPVPRERPAQGVARIHDRRKP